MANASLIVAGSRITASVIKSIAPQAVIKGADQSVTSSVTLAPDDDLSLAVIAGASYLFEFYLAYEAATGQDLQAAWDVPSGASLRYQAVRVKISGAETVEQTVSAASVWGAQGGGAGVVQAASGHGTLVVATTPGSLQLNWAQNTSGSTATIVHAQSYAALWRIT